MMPDVLGVLLRNILVVGGLGFCGIVLAHHGSALLRTLIRASGHPQPTPPALLTDPPEVTTSSFARQIALPALAVLAAVGIAAAVTGGINMAAPNAIGTAATFVVLILGYGGAAILSKAPNHAVVWVFHLMVLLLLAITVAANIAHVTLTAMST